jgi:hypothetical protein
LLACLALGVALAACSSAPSSDRVAAPATSVPVGTGAEITSALGHDPVLDELGVPDLDRVTVRRTFRTGFEDPADLAGFYVTPQSDLTHHEVSTEQVHLGTAAHTAWVTGAGGPGLERDGPNHRGYPTIQLHRLPEGGFRSPTVTELWVWLDVALAEGQWFSFATFSNDASDRWDRVVTVNLDPDGYVNVFHAPRQYENDLVLQRTDVRFPLRTWVRLTTYVDLRPRHGAIAVWQDGVLVSASRVDPAVDEGVRAARDQQGLPPGEISDRLEQAHFGLYAPPEVASARVVNDDLTIAEVEPPSR